LLSQVRLDQAGTRTQVMTANETLRAARARFEREYISAVLAHFHGRIPDAAKSLGIQRTNLYRKLRHLELRRDTASPARF
jgi:DNA-binding NtrC family response regulator